MKWHRIRPGLYKLGTITVERIPEYHHRDHHFIWHVKINGKLLRAYPYLRDAKKAAHKAVRINL